MEARAEFLDNGALSLNHTLGGEMRFKLYHDQGLLFLEKEFDILYP